MDALGELTDWNSWGGYTSVNYFVNGNYFNFILYLCSAEEHSSICKQILVELLVVPSSRRSISPSSSRSRPGSNWSRSSPRIPLSSTSHSWSAARSFRQKSILFTNISGSLELPFFVLLRPLEFPALKLELSFLETKTFLPWNFGFA